MSMLSFGFPLSPINRHILTAMNQCSPPAGTARSHFWRHYVGYGTANSAPEYLEGLAARISSRTSRTVCASVWGPMPGWKIFSDRWLTAWGCLASAPFSPSAKSATKAVRKLGGVATPRTYDCRSAGVKQSGASCSLELLTVSTADCPAAVRFG